MVGRTKIAEAAEVADQTWLGLFGGEGATDAERTLAESREEREHPGLAAARKRQAALREKAAKAKVDADIMSHGGIQVATAEEAQKARREANRAEREEQIAGGEVRDLAGKKAVHVIVDNHPPQVIPAVPP